MTRFSGSQAVESGAYWSLRYGGLYLRDEGVLPGNPASTFYRVPFGVMILLVIGLGGFYILLFPLLIIATAAYGVGMRVLGSVWSQVRQSMSFGWRPTEAYLAGKKDRKPEDEKEKK
jgi:hypothetical protein